MDKKPSHQTHSVTYQIDRKGVGNIIDMGSITLLLVWFDYNRLIMRIVILWALMRNFERPYFSLVQVVHKSVLGSLHPFRIVLLL